MGVDGRLLYELLLRVQNGEEGTRVHWEGCEWLALVKENVELTLREAPVDRDKGERLGEESKLTTG